MIWHILGVAAGIAALVVPTVLINVAGRMSLKRRLTHYLYLLEMVWTSGIGIFFWLSGTTSWWVMVVYVAVALLTIPLYVARMKREHMKLVWRREREFRDRQFRGEWE